MAGKSEKPTRANQAGDTGGIDGNSPVSENFETGKYTPSTDETTGQSNTPDIGGFSTGDDRIHSETKRGRGRPPKTTNGTNTETAYVHQKEKVKRGRPKGSSKKSEPMMSLDEAVGYTQMIISFVNAAAVSTLGTPEAKINEMEETLLMASIPHYLANMRQESVEKAQGVLFPFMTAVAIGSYGIRMYKISRDKSSQQNDVENVEYPREQPIIEPVQEYPQPEVYNNVPV